MINNSKINKWKQQYENDPNNALLENIISHNPLNKISQIRDNLKSFKPIYNISVKPHLKVTNQKSSGRCWLFAALNVIRREMVSKYDIEDFEFSQSYLFFWDKLERMNYNLECIIQTKQEDIDGRLVQHLLNDPSCDGGQWDMIVNLVKKYGLVPKDAYRETHHSSNSNELNAIITKKFREWSHNLRTSKDPHLLKEKYMKETFSILCKVLGRPPTNFDWEYKDKKENYNIIKNLTPIDFYKAHVPFNIEDYVCLINDPRREHPYNKIYTVQYLGNVLDGDKVKYLNLPIERIKELTLKTLKDGKSVWFGCDVGQYLNKEVCAMDMNLIRKLDLFNSSFKLNKEMRLKYKDSLMTHAMVITGSNVSKEENCIVFNPGCNDEKVNYWEVENSWDKHGPMDGYYYMTDDWFDEFV